MSILTLPAAAERGMNTFDTDCAVYEDIAAGHVTAETIDAYVERFVHGVEYATGRPVGDEGRADLTAWVQFALDDVKQGRAN